MPSSLVSARQLPVYLISKVTAGPEWELFYTVKIILQFRSTKPLNMENRSMFVV
jgi:hypothetical protein